MDTLILPAALGKQSGTLRFFNVGRPIVLREEISDLKPVKPRLKINLPSHPARSQGLVKCIHYMKYSVSL